MFLLHAINLFPVIAASLDLSLYLLIAAVIIIYIVVFIPEGIIISYAQVERIKFERVHQLNMAMAISKSNRLSFLPVDRYIKSLDMI